MSSEQERLDRFDRAMTRLMQAHQDALEACRGCSTIATSTRQVTTWDTFQRLPRS